MGPDNITRAQGYVDLVMITSSGAITQDETGLPSGFVGLCGQIVPSGPTQLWFYSSADTGVLGKVLIG